VCYESILALRLADVSFLFSSLWLKAFLSPQTLISSSVDVASKF
ncbi:hypothetical protein A2U01_0075866, partial [Trifolium medium]|nr:hypothetical protein [Trifolium medium]